ncbi:hypothetical protein CFP56_033922, partial [Quercus suber]
MVPFDAQRIRAIPLCDISQPNFLYWALKRNGIYSVKSRHRALCKEARSGEASSSNSVLLAGFWSSIWKPNIFFGEHGSFQDLVARIMSKSRVREVFATMAWFIWSHKNKSRLQEQSVPPSDIKEATDYTDYDDEPTCKYFRWLDGKTCKRGSEFEPIVLARFKEKENEASDREIAAIESENKAKRREEKARLRERIAKEKLQKYKFALL